MVGRSRGTSVALWAVLGVLVVAAAAVIWAIAVSDLGTELSASNSTATAVPTTTPPNLGGVPEEQQPPPEETATPAPGASVVPFISGAVLSSDRAFVTVRSFVPGIEEEGGTCEAVLEGAGEPLTASAAAYIEVSTTTCPPLVIDVQGRPTDALSVTVTYRSGTASGTSEPLGVQQ